MKKISVDPWTYTTRHQNQNMVRLSSEDDLDLLMEKVGDSRYVLLGEASHGTHEYYTWRTAISKRLIVEKGFDFIAVEGDWPDCYQINRFIKNYRDADRTLVDVLKNFQRWPTWMWANWEVAALAEWLREHNRQAAKKAGFYGLDVYSLWESLDVLLNYLDRNDPEAAQMARRAILCFEPYSREGQEYAKALMTWRNSCRSEVEDLLAQVHHKAPRYDHDPEAALNAEQNALVAANAEHYYRSMIAFNDESWNLRDRHMAETLNRLMKFHGPNARAIVWEHNTHIGDARATDMALSNLLNVGQIVREEHGKKEVFVVGFGSYQGSVIAGSSWGAPMQTMIVPPARAGSFEEILHSDGDYDKLVIFDPSDPEERFLQRYPHRAIGVVYNPLHDRYGNYVPSIMAQRYDAFIYIDETRALHPLNVKADMHEVPETYPFAV